MAKYNKPQEAKIPFHLMSKEEQLELMVKRAEKVFEEKKPYLQPRKYREGRKTKC